MVTQTQSALPPPVYHELVSTELEQLLGTDLVRGLPVVDILVRRSKYGVNELTVKPGKPPWLRFLLQFHQPLLYILLLAGLIKALLGAWANAAVIWGVTIINAVIGFVQETKAEGAIAALAKAVTTEATVIRGGQKLRIASAELVPGDLVLLSSGDKVPADLRLLDVRNLTIAEAALTGESLPVPKNAHPLPAATPLSERTNMAYASSFVTSGQGKGLVVAIGNGTQVGQISQSLETHTGLSTPLTRKFDKFSQTLLYVILAVATLTFVVGIGRGQSWVEMFEAAVALAVSAIPEGLPAVVTVTLAIGVNRMAHRHAIIRKLPAVETLGSTTVICSDKTGTLTENQMTVQSILAGGKIYTLSGVGYAPEGDIYLDNEVVDAWSLPSLEACLMAGLLCNDSHLEQRDGQWLVVGDPTEGALITAARKAGLYPLQMSELIPRLDSIPFESDYQYMATLHQITAPVQRMTGFHAQTDDRQAQGIILVKGSVEAVLRRCSRMLDHRGELVPLYRGPVNVQVEQMAAQGLRVLCFAQKPVSAEQQTLQHQDIDTGLTFLGLQGMIDPPRSEAIAAVRACQLAGIQVKMITGDHLATATAIAEQIGLHQQGQVQAFSGQQLEQMQDSDLSQAVEAGVVFARVAPAQKLRLVEALQAKGEVVAMTGDGVNDAPALKQADIGIAMGRSGTDVAKEAADMLLTDDNFASIAAAVEEGRTVYQNLRKAIAFILPVNGGESMTILISALLARELPILSLQVLWLNMVNSVAMTVPLAFEPKSERTMASPPRDPREPLLTGSLFQRIAAVSIFNWILIFGMFEWGRQMTGDLAVARTMAIQALVAGRIVYLLSVSHLGGAIAGIIQGRKVFISHTYALGLGILGAIALQVLFSQWSVMNILFKTAPLNFNQCLICLLPILPMMGLVLFVNRLDPTT